MDENEFRRIGHRIVDSWRIDLAPDHLSIALLSEERLGLSAGALRQNLEYRSKDDLV
jgi:hypothetical protein